MNEQLMNRQASGMGEYQESKALSEIKGKMFLARTFPRDPDAALANVLRECQRPQLAEAAMYEFPRGDSVVRGPSIRLVEVLARHWGNIDSGVQEIEAGADQTTIKCYAWDLETNVSDEKTFSVPHVRATKRGTYKLTDERDVYEAVANKGARRKRACLLAVMPGWYVDEAVAACDATLKAALTDGGQSMEDVIQGIVDAFGGYGITLDQISEKIGRPIEKLNQNDVVKLRRLYLAIKDGFVKPGDAFGQPSPEERGLPSDQEAEALEELNEQIRLGGPSHDPYAR